MRKNISKSLRRFLKNPKTSLVIGIILLFCGVMEGVETVFEKVIGLHIKMHHGVMLFAIAQILLAFVHIIDGIEDITLEEVEEEIK